MLVRAGQYIRDYKPRTNLHTIINDLYDKRSVKSMLLASAIIERQVQFPDVSFYQEEIDWNIMAAKTSAVIIRAGQGIWSDIRLERNYTQAKQRNLKIGFYWFYDGRFSPQAQAELILSLLEGKEFEMEVFIDWERSYSGAHEGLRNVVALMELIEAKGYIVGLYTGYYWFRGNSNSITNASQYNYLKDKRLWLAWYTTNPLVVLIPAPWTRLHHWQWGTPIVEWGQKTAELDMNYFNGTAQEFNALYGGDPAPPNQGGDLKNIVGEAVGNVKRRRSPGGAEFSPSRYLMAGDKIKANDNYFQWLRLTEINGVPLVDEEWASAGSQQQYIQWSEVPVEPEPEPEPDPEEPVVKTHSIDIYSDGKISVDGGSQF